MTSPQPPDALRRWLAAEEAAPAAPPDVPGWTGTETGEHDTADAAFAALFAGQPLSAPPAGFADRVMARAFAPETGAAPASAPLLAPPGPAAAVYGQPRRPWARSEKRHLSVRSEERRPWAARRLAPALGVAAAAAIAAAPLWLPLLLRGMRPLVSASTISWALQGAIGAVQGYTQLVAALASWANTFWLLAMAVAKPLMVPPVAAFAILSLTISVLSLRSLHALIQRDRRWVYADPI
jgi:hypothetical protein